MMCKVKIMSAKQMFHVEGKQPKNCVRIDVYTLLYMYLCMYFISNNKANTYYT